MPQPHTSAPEAALTKQSHSRLALCLIKYGAVRRETGVDFLQPQKAGDAWPPGVKTGRSTNVCAEAWIPAPGTPLRGLPEPRRQDEKKSEHASEWACINLRNELVKSTWARVCLRWPNCYWSQPGHRRAQRKKQRRKKRVSKSITRWKWIHS